MIRARVTPRPKDLGGFSVRRVLPAAGLRNVGPLVFFDEMGPADFAPGQGIDVRPHPHIGLATITYLFDGEITHRDSTGAIASIRPGDVNLMTDGHGVTHSERTGGDVRAAGHRLHGLQTWIALPQEHEEASPAFAHTPGAVLPRFTQDGVAVTVICGAFHDRVSPARALADTLYVALEADEPGTITIPETGAERGLYVIAGAVRVGDEALEAGTLAAFEPGDLALDLAAGTRAALVGGAPLDGPRHLSWNFVSSSEERLEQAGRDWTLSTQSGWKDGPFRPPAGDADEFIPLP